MVQRMNSTRNPTLALHLLLGLLLLPGLACGAPGDTLFSDDFNDGSLAPWSSSNGFRAGTLNGGQFSASPPAGAFTRFGPVTVTGPTFNASVPAARLDIWVRRGSDAFSEDTDAGEDFVLEYRRSNGSWGTLRIYEGGGTNGQVFQDQFILPGDALHGSLAIRVRQTAGSGFGFDYWHFDDVTVTEIAPAATLGVGRCDDFESGLSNWTIAAGSGQAGVGAQTFQSPSNALFLSSGDVSVSSDLIDTSDPSFGDITVWVRRGSDAFSENPEGQEDLFIEYLDATNNWVELEEFNGGGQPGAIFARRYTLPADGRHAGFRLRFRMPSGSGPGFDFWHVDDVCFEQSALPSLQVTKVRQLLSDPVNNTSNPLDIPGAIMLYTITVSNNGPGQVDTDSLRITDRLPPDTELFVDDSAGDPVSFTDGTTPSGLSFTYPDDIAFSDQPDGSPNGYLPTADADGFDAAVTGILVTPRGTMNGATGGDSPTFSVTIRLRLR